MPIHRSSDEHGPYYQWGNHGKKYYYMSGNIADRQNAYNNAYKQAIAIYVSGWREK